MLSAHIAEAFLGRPAMIEPNALRDMLVTGREPRRVMGAPDIENGIGVIRIVGPLYPDDYAELRTQLKAFAEDSRVRSVVLSVDSPGGSVSGAFELAYAIRELRGRKPVIGHVAGAAHSSGYLQVSQATAVYTNPTGSVGSIGVIVARQDVSQALESMGVRVHLVTSGQRKADGSPFQPMGDDERQAIQGGVDEFARMFFEAVATGRGMTVDEVERLDAGVFVGRQAEKTKLIDGVMSLDEVVQEARRLTSGGAYMAATMDACGESLEAPEIVEAAPSADLIADAVNAERTRVASLEDAAAGRPHLDALLARAKFEGMTLDEFKVAAYDVAPNIRAIYTAGVLADSPVASVSSMVVAEYDAPRLRSSMTRDEQARVIWEASAELRDKYLSRFETFLHSEDLNERLVV